MQKNKSKKKRPGIQFRWSEEALGKLTQIAKIRAVKKSSPDKLAREIIEAWLWYYMTIDERERLGFTKPAIVEPPIIRECLQAWAEPKAS